MSDTNAAIRAKGNSPSDYALVGDPKKKSTWHWPIWDAKHARLAIQMWEKADPKIKTAEAHAKILAAAKKFGIDTDAFEKKSPKKSLGGSLHYRLYTNRAVEGDDGSFTFSISSQKPFHRNEGDEILSHQKGAVDLSRLNNAAPVLVDHYGDQVGVVDHSWIDDGPGRAYAKVRFSNSQRGQDIAQDIRDGIRRNVSIGYDYDPADVERSADGTSYTVKKWTPHEVSIVSVPADTSVGVNRSRRQPEMELDGEDEDQQVVDALGTGSGIVHDPDNQDYVKDDEEDDLAMVHADDCDCADCDSKRGDNALTGNSDDYDDITHDEDPEDASDEAEFLDKVTQATVEGETDQEAIEAQLKENTKKGLLISRPHTRDQTMSELEKKPPVVRDNSEATRKEAGEVLKLAAQHGCIEKAGDWISRGLSMEAVQREILDMKATNNAAVRSDDKFDVKVELDEKQNREYSLLNLFRIKTENALSNKRDTSFETEVSDEISKKMEKHGRTPKMGAFYVPTSMRTTLSTTEQQRAFKRALDAGLLGSPGGTAGGSNFTVFAPGQFIDVLRAQTHVVDLGAQMFSGLTQKLQLPRQDVTEAVSWLAEDPASGFTITSASYDQVTLVPRTLLYQTAYSKQLLAIESWDIENIVRNGIAKSFAVAFDKAAIQGSTSSYAPQGILNYTQGASNALGTYPSQTNLIAASASMQTTGSALQWQNINLMVSAVARQNVDVSVETMGWLTTPSVRSYLRSTAKFPGNTVLTMMESDNDILSGYRLEVSMNVPNGQTVGGVTGTDDIIFGDWSKVLLGEFGALEFIIDPYTAANQWLVKITAGMLADVEISIPSAFSVCTNAGVASY